MILLAETKAPKTFLQSRLYVCIFWVLVSWEKVIVSYETMPISFMKLDWNANRDFKLRYDRFVFSSMPPFQKNLNLSHSVCKTHNEHRQKPVPRTTNVLTRSAVCVEYSKKTLNLRSVEAKSADWSSKRVQCSRQSFLPVVWNLDVVDNTPLKVDMRINRKVL